jgi:uncharacterized MAPEG superfamily protein
VTAWTVLVVLYLAYLALWTLGLRKTWRNPRPPARGPRFFAAETRRTQRTAHLALAMIMAMFGVGLAGYGADHLHGLASDTCSVLGVVFLFVAFVALILTGTVRWLNWPAAVVPPSLRDDPGYGVELMGRWRARRNRD